MEGHARKNCLNTTTWRTTSIQARTKVQIRLKIDGNANVQLDIWGRRVNDLCARTIRVTMVEHALNSLEADTCACAHWENMDITVNIVRTQ
jgi:hypothetical protein